MTRTIADQRAAMPAAFREQMDAITTKANADKRAGGSWRVYLANPGGRGLHLHWSFATEAEAQKRLAILYPSVRLRAEIRHEA